MNRVLLQTLLRWLEDPSTRGPVILRGARQVGKTWLIRELARQAGRALVEVNFERDPRLAHCFETSDPLQILSNLGLETGTHITAEGTLLFLDEVQARPEVLKSLRWFREELPNLPVVAAGSLLEFALAELSFSMPVGRVGYRHLEPMGFDEFLEAHGQDQLLTQLRTWEPTTKLGAIAHEKASDWYHRYSMIGGMPAVVTADVDGHPPEICRELQVDLMATFRDDFAKYSGRVDPRFLDSVLLSVARQLGGRLVYSHVDPDVRHSLTKLALEMLGAARLVTIVPHSAARGVPLGAEAVERKRKVILLDVGLLHALIRTPAQGAFPRAESLGESVRSRLAEQLVGQQVRCLAAERGEAPTLHYWQRAEGRPAEVDYVAQIGVRIVPIEVKAGSSGTMKSLHQFVHDRCLDLAVRVDTNPPSLQQLDVKTTVGDPIRYRLLNLPGYLVFRLGELVAAMDAE